jgi:thiol-disulfide isomerase/thioredoxin
MRSVLPQILSLAALSLLVSAGSTAVTDPVAAAAADRFTTPVDRPAPEISGTWINSEPLKPSDLRGKVVLVEFWTLACFNCRNVEPYVKQWHKKFVDRGLVVIGIHTPETAYERDIAHVRQYLREHQIAYPVVTDESSTDWDRFGTDAWPTVYLIDKRGIVRYAHVGEGAYSETERRVEALLAEP